MSSQLIYAQTVLPVTLCLPDFERPDFSLLQHNPKRSYFLLLLLWVWTPSDSHSSLEQLLARSVRPTRENLQKAGPRIFGTEIWCSKPLLWPISFCKCTSQTCLYCPQQLLVMGPAPATSPWLWSLPAAQVPRLRLLFLPPQCQAVWPCPPGGMSQQQQEHFTWLTISPGISMATPADAVSLMAPKEPLHSHKQQLQSTSVLVISKGAKG